MRVNGMKAGVWADYNKGKASQSMIYYINVLSSKTSYGWNISNILSLC
jgi:hypothetical protein